MDQGLHSAPMTVALALITGIVSQSVARHLQVPGIVVLLGAGVLLGPDGAGLVLPDLLGDALFVLVGFAVAVILFEGALTLDLRRLRRENRAIRQLVLADVLVTSAGAALCSRVLMGWPWRHSVLFGALVMVTGPTVVTPLVRRFRLERSTATVLEAEGVLIDAIGAVVAAVTLEVALSPSASSVAFGLAHVPASLATGAVIGLAGGAAMVLALRTRRLVPAGLENVMALALVVTLFQLANALVPESGIAAVVVAGFVMGTLQTHAHRELLEFKEQLTALFIGMLFVLLAADVRLKDVAALGAPGVWTVAMLVLVVRPATVLLGTAGTELGMRQRALLSAIGPRGIVAAAVASFFAVELERNRIGGGEELRALVFLVIVVTVVAATLIGGPLAGLLHLRRPSDRGYVILGANALARTLARVLLDAGHDAVCVDTNAGACAEAERQGIPVITGNGLRPETLERAEIETRLGAIALTPSTEVNLLFLQQVRREARRVTSYIAVAPNRSGSALDLARAAGAEILFGRPEPLELWSERIRSEGTELKRYVAEREVDAAALSQLPDELILGLASSRAQRVTPLTRDTKLRPGDELLVLACKERAADADARLGALGFMPRNEAMPAEVA